MATQTLEFNATTGLTISCKLFALGSDTVLDTQTATEKTNAKNRYSVAFADAPAQATQLIGFVDGVGGFANEIYDLTEDTATFYPRSESKMRGTDSAALASGVIVSTNNDKTGYSLTPTTGLGNQTANITGVVSGNSTHNAAAVLSALGTGTWATDIPWNSDWDAEVQSECVDALIAYGGPTKAEVDAAIDTLLAVSPAIVERSIADENSITFAWPVSGATITGQKSINNGTYTTTSGDIEFLRTENSKHYYTLAYSSYDRPTEEGVVRYKLTDDTYTRYINLRVEPVYTESLTNIQNSLDTGVMVSGLTSDAVSDIFETYKLGESYAATGIEGTPAQLLYAIQQTFSDFGISGTTVTVRKLDGSTALTFTLDDDTNPLSRTRAT